MSKEELNDRLKNSLGRAEERLNGAIKESRISWGLIILIVAGCYALWKLISCIFYFF